MKRKVELLVLREDERILLRSPEVGLFTCALDRESLVGQRAPAGVVITLGETVELVVPSGVFGRVISPRPERVRAPVGYGDVLYELAPLESIEGADTAAAGASADSGAPVFPAPHSGRFWRRSSPSDPNFVDEGDAVEAGTTLGLIEVMKTFTHVTYAASSGLPERGRVARFLVGDGDEVTEGDALAEIEPA